MFTQLEGNWAFGDFVVTACPEQCDGSVLGDGRNERGVIVRDGRSSSGSNNNKLHLCVSYVVIFLYKSDK